MSLAAIQDLLQAHLLEGERAIEPHVVGTSPQDVVERLAIYSTAYRARLTEALASNYPALTKLLGDDDFGALADRYIAAHVSRRPSIRYYGDALPEFLATQARYRDVPLLVELAIWEWAITEVFDAADAHPIDAATLAGVPPAEWAELRFTLHAALRQLDLNWNIPPQWKALTSGLTRPAAELASAARSWLLWRDGLQIHFRSLDAAEAVALRAMREQRSFGELCLNLCGAIDEAEAPRRAAGYLRGWVAAGLITGIVTS